MSVESNTKSEINDITISKQTNENLSRKNDDETTLENTDEETQSDAYNPETGEINWDCPCLGGMAKGPCGEQFKAAFSCFIYSKAEQKGADCLDAFREMNDCFKKYPDVYKNELADDNLDDLDDPDNKEE
ncbi:14378_t:CDS:2 [Gigaspora margarita]|uniref:Mitochondrial intermembrane space import and assembly protein 40 n=2 Tax=Gigaspora margarita TaxID=4874 RepID=A0A8H4AQ10_GIGMA|nr:Mitochondrial intermembrane space import and assembly protein 40 [Gigaspora margarita]CAG8598539.1 14378_t:CDS:2 [Gigaspora margarita]